MTLTHWEDIRAEALRRIRAREWRPGEVIPGEEALAVEFGCARATVNRALRDLAASGVLERRRKAGTRVALHPVRKARLDIPVTRAEVEGRGQRYGYRLIAMAKAAAPAAVTAKLGLAQGAQLLRVQCLHLADDLPFLLEDRWLNADILPAPLPDFTVTSVNEYLVAHVGYLTADIAFSAANADTEEAAKLGVPAGAALFVVERATWGESAPITWVRLAYAPGYRIQTSL